MFWILILLFTVFPILELVAIIKVGQSLGIFNTVTLILTISILGGYLSRLQGFLILQKIQNNLQRGILPTAEMLDGLLVFCAGILLLIPGFISDIFGLILLFPATRWLVKKLLRLKMQSMLKNGQVITVNRVNRFKNFD